MAPLFVCYGLIYATKLLVCTTYFFRGLDSNSYENLHKTLVIHLGKCALSFLGKTAFSDRDLVVTFCCTTLTEYVKSPVKDQVFKVTSSPTSGYTHLYIFHLPS